LSLGLTGGGGAIFAVPLLVYGLGIPPREAVAISLAAVGATALVGFLHRWRLGQVELPTGLAFAAAGAIGAPIGAWIAGRMPEPLLLTLFAGLMLLVAVRLWRQASPRAIAQTACPVGADGAGPTCRRDASGRLLMTSRCAVLLAVAGLLSGVLSGLFGVGGGFVIVPALILYSRMPIHRAVGTSLMVIALVSVAGIASQLVAGHRIDPVVTALFVAGGVAGLFLGQHIGRRLSGPVLQRVFVAAIVGVAGFVLVRNLST
jgi:hypothetical protein